MLTPQSLLPQNTVLPIAGVAAPLRRWALALPAASPLSRPLAEAFATTGGLVSGDELAALLRAVEPAGGTAAVPQPISRVAQWIVSGAVVAFGGPRAWLLPLFQFDLSTGTVRPGMAALRAELLAVFDEIELALWFVAPNDWLGGARPALALRSDLPAVLRAARADRYVARGG